MVETVLTKEMIDSGAHLIRRLDERSIQPDAAFWLYFPDKETWKLVIAEMQVSKLGPKQGYQKIQQVLREFDEEIPQLALDDITLLDTDAPVVSLLRSAIRTGPGISGIRFKGNVINGTVVEDAYIYRLN